jgi:hypothetical protein
MLPTSVGTPLDVTAEGLALERLFSADDATEPWLRARAEAPARGP